MKHIKNETGKNPASFYHMLQKVLANLYLHSTPFTLKVWVLIQNIFTFKC